MHLSDVVDTLDAKKEYKNKYFVLFKFCRFFQKPPDFNDFFNFRTLADLFLRLNFYTLIETCPKTTLSGVRDFLHDNPKCGLRRQQRALEAYTYSLN